LSQQGRIYIATRRVSEGIQNSCNTPQIIPSLTVGLGLPEMRNIKNPKRDEPATDTATRFPTFCVYRLKSYPESELRWRMLFAAALAAKAVRRGCKPPGINSPMMFASHIVATRSLSLPSQCRRYAAQNYRSEEVTGFSRRIRKRSERDRFCLHRKQPVSGQLATPTAKCCFAAGGDNADAVATFRGPRVGNFAVLSASKN
jgi:hypothetical protein